MRQPIIASARMPIELVGTLTRGALRWIPIHYETTIMQLRDVNTTDIGDAIRLGCQAMSRAFNADDADMPYGGAQVRPEAFLRGSMEGHMPGRLLNADAGG